MVRLFSVLFLFVSVSCTLLRHTRGDVLETSPFVRSSKLKNVQLRFVNNGDMYSPDRFELLEIKKIFQDNFLSHNCVMNFTDDTKNPNETALIQIERETDNRYSSWKPYVTGFSLGVIPIKYNYQYHLSILTNNQLLLSEKEKLEGWNHFLFMIFIFSPGRARLETDIYKNFSALSIEALCNENRKY